MGVVTIACCEGRGRLDRFAVDVGAKQLFDATLWAALLVLEAPLAPVGFPPTSAVPLSISVDAGGGSSL